MGLRLCRSTGLLRRLGIFRSQNEDDTTVLNYFDELEIHPEHIGTTTTATTTLKLLYITANTLPLGTEPA